MSSTNENINIGKRLADFRNGRGLNQKEFSSSLGVSLRGYQNYERGEREISAELVRALYVVYQIDPIWILTGGGAMLRAQSETNCISVRVTELTEEQRMMINHLIEELADGNKRNNIVKRIADQIRDISGKPDGKKKSEL